ncbi:MAG: P-II family nitrogen regulator [Oscillospiraceae bacterium]|nr:P-II family nitrogen regulator [Oscillospiraceae bacterium]
MKMVRAIIRPEMVKNVMDALEEKGFISVTEMDVYGRGKQNGITIGSVKYDELPKTMLFMIIEDKDCDTVCRTILDTAKTNGGTIGDGRIFVLPVEQSYTISSGKAGV